MAVDLQGRSLLTLRDFTAEEIKYLLDLARELKEAKKSGKRLRGDSLWGKNIVLLFEKASTRTRCAFEVAAFDEGAQVTFLTNSQMGKKESMEDTAKVLGRFYDGIEFRGFSQKTVEELARWSGVPVWNGLTDDYHPTQVLADFMTAMEHLDKPLEEMKLVFVGDARNNVANSLMIGAAKLGMDFTAASPASLRPDERLVSAAQEYAAESGSVLDFVEDPFEAVKGADIIYTDVWVSMGEESRFAERIALLTPYQVTMDLLRASGNPDVIFEHCLPAFHDLETTMGYEAYTAFGIKEQEVTDEVFRSRHSVVFDEAENRMHTIKAVMVATCGRKGTY